MHVVADICVKNCSKFTWSFTCNIIGVKMVNTQSKKKKQKLQTVELILSIKDVQIGDITTWRLEYFLMEEIMTDNVCTQTSYIRISSLQRIYQNLRLAQPNNIKICYFTTRLSSVLIGIGLEHSKRPFRVSRSVCARCGY